MRRAKHTQQAGRKKNAILLLASLVLLLTLTVTGTAAFLTDSPDNVVNTFQIAKVPNTIVEEFDGSTKEDVQIQNTGNVDAYIRAALVFSWQDAEGNMYHEPPAAADYTAVFPSDTGWKAGRDGYYYYIAGPVAPGARTGILMSSCTVAENATVPENYFLTVEVVSQSVQADGVTSGGVPAVTDAWGIAVNADGTLNVA